MVEEHRYLISEAAKIVAVEAHVLRYWEDELEIPIGRTELGHRYYTRENIEIFQNVKKLKEEGLQLKAIKAVLQSTNYRPEEDARKAQQEQMTTEQTSLKVMQSNAEKLRQFKELVEEIVEKVVKDNNEELQQRLEESMAKETDYLLHMQEKREEERFRRLDEIIRAHQKVAATKEKRRFRDILRRK
ncbi:DNA-binding transcriptional regulator, MerR family [Marvinbryantia formatexigens]|nr:DNA-binding transcriptional regulator, MerR family [Marvinbryantia formatexigens]